MAEGFLRAFLPEFEVRSAGQTPLGRVDPMAVHGMRARGVDIVGQRSQTLEALVPENQVDPLQCRNADPTVPSRN